MSKGIHEQTPGVAILASGNGTTAEAFIEATQDGRVAAAVGLVVCNNPPEKAGIYARIDKLNQRYGLDIEVVEISGRTHPQGNVGRGQTLAESAAICERVVTDGFQLVALMGYLKILRGDLVEQYGWQPSFESLYQARILNTHPGPLPETADTYGIHASERVLELGMPTSRHTVHVVGSGIDRGPIYREHAVAVKNDDSAQSLFERVQTVEKAALPLDIHDFLQEQVAYQKRLAGVPLP